MEIYNKYKIKKVKNKTNDFLFFSNNINEAIYNIIRGFPDGSDSKESACN